MHTRAAIPDRASSKALSFVRSAFAMTSGDLRSVSGRRYLGGNAGRTIARRDICSRAALPNTATTSDDAWAGLLAQDAFGEFLVDLGTMSAAAD